MIATLLVMILAFNLTSNTFLVSGDAGGTGKYLTVPIIGDGFDIPIVEPGIDNVFLVIATKEKSGQDWIYFPNGTDPVAHKLGAGDVILEAIHPEGYSVSWKLGEGDDAPELTENSIVFKAAKYAIVTATFTQDQYHVSFTQNGAGVAPTIAYQIDGGAMITSAVPVTVEVNHGTGISYTYQATVTDGLGTTRYVYIRADPVSPQTVTGSLTITGYYVTEYRLKVYSDYGTPGGAGWYPSDTDAEATVTPLIEPIADDTQSVFTHWSEDASGATSPSDPIIMDKPKIASANWKTQYLVQFAVDLSAGGSTTPSEPTWYDAESSDNAVSATANTGYEFTSWSASESIDIDDSLSPSTTATINSPGTVTAVFTRVYSLNLVQYGIGSVTSDKAGPYFWGEEVTLTFSPINDNHLSSVKDNGVFADLVVTTFTTSYTITFMEDHDLVVRFDPDGFATVDPGLDVTVFLSSSGSLTFTDSGVGGTASGEVLSFPMGTSVLFWEINAGDWAFYDDNYALIALVSDRPISIYTADSPDQLYSDVNGDGVVNQDDKVEVARAISTSGRDYIEKYDINRDGKLNQKDINTVKTYLDTDLTEIPFVPFVEGEDGPFGLSSPMPAWTYNDNIVFIQTDHFSIFRGR